MDFSSSRGECRSPLHQGSKTVGWMPSKAILDRLQLLGALNPRPGQGRGIAAWRDGDFVTDEDHYALQSPVHHKDSYFTALISL
mgnify:CR=1 FL=1